MECANGHTNADGIRYCGECGLALSPTSDGAGEIHHADAPSFLPPPPVAVPPPQPSRRKWPFVLGAVVILGAGFMVMRNRSASDEVTLRGYIMLEDSDLEGSWDSCHGTGGYNDMEAGAFVSLTDAAGTKVGGSSLRNVETSDYEWLSKTGFFTSKIPSDVPNSLEDLSSLFCMLVWDVAVKPSDFYVLEVGTRGESTHNYKDLRANGFVIQLSLGG